MLNLVSPLTVAIAVLPFIFVRQLRRRLFPRDIEIIQEMELHRKRRSSPSMHHQDSIPGDWMDRDDIPEGTLFARGMPESMRSGVQSVGSEDMGCCGIRLGSSRVRDATNTGLSARGKGGASKTSGKVMPMMSLSPMFEKTEDAGPIRN